MILKIRINSICKRLLRLCTNPWINTHHVVDVLQYVGESTDDQGEFVPGDVDQTFLIVFRADFSVCVLHADFHRKLKQTNIHS